MFFWAASPKYAILHFRPNADRKLEKCWQHATKKRVSKKLCLVDQHKSLCQSCRVSWPKLDRTSPWLSVQSLPSQKSKWSCHSLLSSHRSQKAVELTSVSKPVSWLDQLKLVLPQSLRKELRKKVLKPQPMLVQQWLVDLKQRVMKPDHTFWQGQSEQVW